MNQENQEFLKMESDIDRILITEAQIKERVCHMAHEISKSYDDMKETLTIVCILSGSILFVADLIRQIPRRLALGFVTVSSYEGSAIQSDGSLLKQDLNIDISDRHVLLVDDILDTGSTLRLVQTQLAEKNLKSLKTAVLLRKSDKAPSDIVVDFVGFNIEDDFVVGYGLDFNTEYRNLPYIAVLRPELY